MAEHAFFSPHNAEGSCSKISGQETLHNDLRWTSSEYHLLDELRKFAKLKSDILSHPLYEQLLEAHVACLCVGLPSQYFQALETQLADKHSVAIKYLMLGKDVAPDFDCSRKEIDEFMESYILLLHSLKKHLEEHLLPPTTKAMVEYYELEQSFQELTGDSSAKLVNATWYDAEFTDEDLNFGIVGYDGLDDFKVGMDMQKERDRSLMEHVRQELKHELKEGYLECLTSIRDEILRKRQAGKLPADTTILKKWWNAHSKWPYPTEEDKRHMAQETGLELRQINNWFINHRKRNWSGQAMPIEASTSSEGASKSNTSNLSMP